MQEIRETHRADDGTIRERLQRVTGFESDQLRKMFETNRDEANERARQTGGKVEIREVRGISRNDPCPCGSGSKFKKCCGRNLTSEDARVK